jgi:hypothetical protein
MAKTLKSNDGKTYELTEEQVNLSNYLKGKKESEVAIDFNTSILGFVFDYLNNYEILSATPVPEPLAGMNLEEDIGKDNAEFINKIEDWEIVFNLINCALILELNHLHDLACARVANFLKNKSPEEVQKEFTIECQLTAEEAKELGLEADVNA